MSHFFVNECNCAVFGIKKKQMEILSIIAYNIVFYFVLRHHCYKQYNKQQNNLEVTLILHLLIDEIPNKF